MSEPLTQEVKEYRERFIAAAIEAREAAGLHPGVPGYLWRLLDDLERTERELLAAREQGNRNNTERLAHLDRADRAERERDEARAELDRTESYRQENAERLDKAERERDEARDYAAQIATGVAHYPHSEGEPCIRCDRDEARAKLARIVKALEQWYWPDAPGSLRHRHVEQVIAEVLAIAKGER